MSLTFYDLPNDIIREILSRYLQPIDVHSCFLTSKIFHVLSHYELHNKINIVKGLNYCTTVGSLPTLKKIYNLSKKIGHPTFILNDHNYIYKACAKGHFEIVKWIYTLMISEGYTIDLHYCDELMFWYSCTSGNLELVKWLYNICIQNNSPINIRASKDKAFLGSCEKGHTDIVNWLCSKIPAYSYKVKYTPIITG